MVYIALGHRNFFKILKSGCNIEKMQFETVDRLSNFIAVQCILAWRVLYMTRLGESCGDLPASLIFSDLEWKIAFTRIHKKMPPIVI